MNRVLVLEEPEDTRLERPGCPECGHRRFTFRRSQTMIQGVLVEAEYEEGGEFWDYDNEDVLDVEDMDCVDSDDDDTERTCVDCGREYTLDDVEEAMEAPADDEAENAPFSWATFDQLGLQFVKPVLAERVSFCKRFVLEEHDHLVVLRTDQVVGRTLCRSREGARTWYLCPCCGVEVADLDGERRVQVTGGRDIKQRPVLLVMQTCYFCRGGP